VANTGDMNLIALLEKFSKSGTLLAVQIAVPDMKAPESTSPPPPPVAETSFSPAPLREQQKVTVTGLSNLHAPSTPSLKGPGQAPKGSCPTARPTSMPSAGGNRGSQKNPGKPAGVTLKVSTRNIERLEAKFGDPRCLRRLHHLQYQRLG
jgi:hypothetical protein